LTWLLDVWLKLDDDRWPLFIRRVAAKIYSIGGIHSSTAVSGTIWLILFAAQATREMISGGKVRHCALQGWTSLTRCRSDLGGNGDSDIHHPGTLGHHAHIRSPHSPPHPPQPVRTHSPFHGYVILCDCCYRAGLTWITGWTAVGLVWAQVVLLNKDYKPEDISLGHALVKAAPFWLTLILTLSIAGPWTHLRKVKVESEVLSNHCLRIHFDGKELFYSQCNLTKSPNRTNVLCSSPNSDL
jgi:hypothetical protein